MKRLAQSLIQSWRNLTNKSLRPRSTLNSPRSKGSFFVTLQGEIFDPAGILLKRLPERPANSFVQQFIDILYPKMAQETLEVTETDGTGYAVVAAANVFRCNAELGDDTWGIVIGDDNTAVAIDDYFLVSPLTTNIVHGAHNIAEPVTEGTTRRLDITRIFTNNSGGDLTIEEVGLVIIIGTSTYRFLIDRSLYSATVINGNSISLRYRISVTI
ncbi:hypothetical protein ES702_07354 [subsurface metagenome]